MHASEVGSAPFVIGRHTICAAIGAGGMATVHLGRFSGPSGFARTVAIKRLHAHLSTEREFVEMLLDEARVAARVSHPNVISTLDVVKHEGEILLVMEYVHGSSVAALSKSTRRRGERMPPDVACAIVIDVLEGLHAAHEAKDDAGRSLDLVHRDVSPQNVIVGVDGVARVVDFGVAKARGRLQTTREGEIKGKLAYMAPEQLVAKPVTRAADVYAMSVVLWELLTGKRLFSSKGHEDVVKDILFGTIEAPSAVVPDVPEALNAVVLRGVSRDPKERFASARDMAVELRGALSPAPPSRVAEWVKSNADATLAERAAQVAEIAREWSVTETSLAPSARRARRWLLALALAGCVLLIGVIARALL